MNQLKSYSGIKKKSAVRQQSFIRSSVRFIFKHRYLTRDFSLRHFFFNKNVI